MIISKILPLSVVLATQATFAQQSKLVQCTGKDIKGSVLSLSMSVSEKRLANGKTGYDAVANVAGSIGGQQISIKKEVIRNKTKVSYFDVLGYALVFQPSANSMLTVAAYTKDASASLLKQDGTEAELKLTCSGIK